MAEKNGKIQSTETSQTTKRKEEVWYAGLPQVILNTFPPPAQVKEKYDITVVDETFVYTPKGKLKTEKSS